MSWDLLIIGCVGGLIPDAMRIAQNRYHEELPSFVWTSSFWIGLVFLMLIGALAVALAEASSWQQAIAIGYAGPEFLSRALSTKPITLGPPSSFVGIRRWWAF